MQLSTNHLTRSFSAALCVASFGLAGPAAADPLYVKPSVKDAGKLVVGNTLDYAPFEFKDENGKPSGIDIELANLVVDQLGVELEIVQIPFVNALPSLAAGRTDISWASYTIREDRLEQVDFVTFMQAGSVVSTIPERKDDFNEQMDLCGKSLAIIAGGSADFTLERLSGECTEAGNEAIEKAVFPDVASSIQAVISGRVDGRLDDSTASGYFEVTSNGRLVVVPGIYDTSTGGVAVPKGDTETAEMMRGALQAILEDGSMAKVFAGYGMGQAMIEEIYIVTNFEELR